MLKKVQSGQRLQISASTFNTLIDTAETVNRQRYKMGGQNLLRGSSRDLVIVQNKSGAALDRFAVVIIDVPVITPTENLTHFQDVVAFEVKNPTGAAGERVAVLQEPLGIDKFGRACVSGVTPVQINKPINQTYKNVKTVNASNIFTADDTGNNAILWCDSGSGLKWGVVCLSHTDAGTGLEFGKVTTTITYTGAGVSVYTVLFNGASVTVDRIRENGSLAPPTIDMRQYLPWYPVDAWVPLIICDAGHYAINAALVPVGANKTLIQNVTDNRATAVWG